MSARGHLGLGTGVGLVVANMVGAGVFLSAGFMVADLDAGEILLSWAVGLAIALCGAVAYASVAVVSGESGGEYRYLHDYVHPWLGSVAGWASVLVGFAAPIAIDAEAAGAFLHTVDPRIDATWLGTAAIVGLTAVHALHLEGSRWAQDALVAVKVAAVLAFVALGLALGARTWPTWTPEHDTGAFPWKAFVANQYWVAFAFSGWNAAIYAAKEFTRPRRDVPRALLIGCLAVGALYLACNWVFVANLPPARAQLVTESEQVTLAHLVMEDLLGPRAGLATSLVAAWVLLSAQSAMTLVGPRVYAAMGRDGMLPRWFVPAEGRPPVAGAVFQGAIALALLHGRTLLQTVQAAGAVLMVFSALVALTTVSLARRPEGPGVVPVVAGLLYVAAVGVLLTAGFVTLQGLLPAVLAVFVAGTVGWAFSARAGS